MAWFAASPSKIRKTAFPASPGSGRGSNCRPLPSKATPASSVKVRPTNATTWRRRASSVLVRREFTTIQTNVLGTHYLLSAWRSIVPHCRFFFAAPSRCSERRKRFRRTSGPVFIPAPHMASARWLDMTHRITVRPTACTPAAAFCSTTSRRGAVRVRHAKDYSRGGTHPCRQVERAASGEPRCQARLGTRPRIRRSHVAYAPATGARRLRGCHRRNPFRQGVCGAGIRPRRVGLAGLRQSRSGSVPAGGGQSPPGKRRQGPQSIGVESPGDVSGTRARDAGA